MPTSLKNSSSSVAIPRTQIEPASQFQYFSYFFNIILGHLVALSLIRLSLFLQFLFELLDLQLLTLANFARVLDEVSVLLHHVCMRGLQLFMRVVQDTVKQIYLDSALVFWVGSSHQHHSVPAPCYSVPAPCAAPAPFTTGGWLGTMPRALMALW